MSPNDIPHMRRALELARRGQGAVEPNPQVGCVVVRDDAVVGEGWHAQFGGPHAEVAALQAAGSQAAGATLYVSLEPCCHQGKTPPCAQTIIDAGVGRVVVAMSDPFPAVSGGGVQQLRAAGLQVDVGILEEDSRRLNAPYLKLVGQGRPWVIAKWAMTLDGKIATRTGDSRWISGEASRAIVHRLRGRVDAILIGRGTADADDPLLTARPPGPRTAARIVLDRTATLPVESQLVRTAADVPVIVASAAQSAPADRRRLTDAGCQVLICQGDDDGARLAWLLDELGRRQMTNLLVEGGGAVLGQFFDAGAVDEAHIFIAPRVAGGQAALSPVGGAGVAQIADAFALAEPQIETVGDDVYVHGCLHLPRRA